MRAPRQRLSASRRANRRPLGARDASQACAGVDAGRPYSIQAIEAECGLRTQGSTGVEPGTLTTLLRFGPTNLLNDNEPEWSLVRPTETQKGIFESRPRADLRLCLLEGAGPALMKPASK